MFLWFKLFVVWKVDFPNLWKTSQNTVHVHTITCITHTYTHIHRHTNTCTLAFPAPLKNNYTISVPLHNNKPACDLHDGLVMNSTCQNWLSYTVSKGIYRVCEGTDGPWLVSPFLLRLSLTRKLKSWGLWCALSHRGLTMLLVSDLGGAPCLISKSLNAKSAKNLIWIRPTSATKTFKQLTQGALSFNNWTPKQSRTFIIDVHFFFGECF